MYVGKEQETQETLFSLFHIPGATGLITVTLILLLITPCVIRKLRSTMKKIFYEM